MASGGLVLRRDTDSPISMDLDAGGIIDGGFERDMFIDDGKPPLGDQHICKVCNKVLRNPRMRQCGHIYCKRCLEKLKVSSKDISKSVYCPECILIEDVIDESQITAGEMPPSDYAMQRSLATRKAKCLQEGCTYIGLLREYEADHEMTCERAMLPCPYQCGEMVHISLVRVHQLDCPMRPMTCQCCHAKYPKQDEQAHVEVCPNRPVLCDLCDKQMDTRQQLVQHREKECPYFKCTLGCDLRISRDEIESHYKDPKLTSKHMSHVVLKFDSMSREIKQVATASHAVVVQETGSRGLDKQQLADFVNQLSRMGDQVATLDNICSVFKVEFEKMFDSAVYNKRRTDEVSMLQQEMQERLQRLEQAVQIRDVQLMERDLRLKALEEVSYDGTLVWRIDNFSEWRRKAKDGEATSIYSPAFYTSRCGYKVCARLYLNGDGIGKGTHISFFFVVMRGQYDGLLRWPFQQKVTMMLLDYTTQHHIMDAFRCDPASASFHKPKNEMNVASGCPLFMPLSALNEKITNHARDDVAYFKIIVDCSDIPY